MGKITIISGKKNSGKTLLCGLLVKELKSRGKKVTGIISPGLYKDAKKVGIMVENVQSGQKVQIAKYMHPGWDKKRPEREWLFYQEGIEWGNRKLEKALPTDYLFIDEIGYLELEEGSGWKAALEYLESGEYKHAFIVIRPSLLEIAAARWAGYDLVMINQGEDLDKIAKKILAHLSDSE